MFIFLCGTGVGFSVERQFVSKLPDVPDELFNSVTPLLLLRIAKRVGLRHCVR
jgi:hypothetical protein